MKESNKLVDNRSAGVFGIGGALNFKSGDISGTAAKTADDRASQGTEYFSLEQQGEEDNFKQNPYTDRSAQLRATLNSLALMNVANVINSKKRSSILDEKKHASEEDEEEAFNNEE